MKLSELFRTKSKQSSPDMFNFYVVLTSHDTVTDVGRVSTFRRNFNSLFYYKRKMKDHPKTWVLTENQFEDFRWRKEQKQNFRPFRKNPMENTEP